MTNRSQGAAESASAAAGGVGALDGVRVLDLSSVGPGARATRILADYGAQVVKVLPVPRDGAVMIKPPAHAYSGNRGMRKVHLNLKAPEGKQAFLALSVNADVILESFRPGVVERLGVGYEAVRAVNEAIVYCSTSGYGQSGPRARWAGHDLNYLATSGFLHCSERSADGTPALPGATVADIAAGGMHAAMAIMAALLRRGRTGAGEYLDVSAADGALAMMSLYADEHLATGADPGPGHYILTGRYACYATYECRDGGFVSVAAIEPAFWRNLCRELDLPQWADHQTDDTCQDQLRAALAERFATATRDEWVARLGPADCCVAPVNTVVEACADEQFRHRGLFAQAVHPTEGSFEQLGPIWAGTSVNDSPYRLPDDSESHVATLLGEAGYTTDEIADLTRRSLIA